MFYWLAVLAALSVWMCAVSENGQHINVNGRLFQWWTRLSAGGKIGVVVSAVVVAMVAAVGLFYLGSAIGYAVNRVC